MTKEEVLEDIIVILEGNKSKFDLEEKEIL